MTGSPITVGWSFYKIQTPSVVTCNSQRWPRPDCLGHARNGDLHLTTAIERRPRFGVLSGCWWAGPESSGGQMGRWRWRARSGVTMTIAPMLRSSSSSGRAVIRERGLVLRPVGVCRSSTTLGCAWLPTARSSPKSVSTEMTQRWSRRAGAITSVSGPRVDPARPGGWRRGRRQRAALRRALGGIRRRGASTGGRWRPRSGVNGSGRRVRRDVTRRL
jgi:hypothetical protein